MIYRCDFFAILHGFLDAWNAGNHAKPLEGLSKSRFHTFRKREAPCPVLGSLWDRFWRPLAPKVTFLAQVGATRREKRLRIHPKWCGRSKPGWPKVLVERARSDSRNLTEIEPHIGSPTPHVGYGVGGGVGTHSGYPYHYI